jgi:glutathione S-transferase
MLDVLAQAASAKDDASAKTQHAQKMKLYEFPPTRSIRARWALQELDVPFDSVVVDMRTGAHKSPGFLALNPAGKLPVLVDGDTVLTESIAIVLYLCEKYPAGGLLPEDLTQRAQVYRWLLFTATELEQPLWRIARHTSMYPEAERLPAEVPLARRDFRDMVSVLEAHLQGRQYVANASFTAADIVCAYTLDWANEVELLAACPNARTYLETMYRRPGAPPRISTALASLSG